METKRIAHTSIEERFRRTDTLTSRKLREFIPVTIATNLSVFMLGTLNSLVAGNLVGIDALASVQIFAPLEVVFGAPSLLVAVGAGTSLSTCMGQNDLEAIRRTKNAVKFTTIVTAAIVALIQFPIIYLIISSYSLDRDIQAMIWEYALGMMVTFPVMIISTVGSHQLMILGKMRALMMLSVIEGFTNLLFDLLFVEVAHLGIAGIGFGDALANVVRCTITLVYLSRETDLLKRNSSGLRLSEVLDILRCGAPDCSSAMTYAVASCFMTGIILEGFGAEGGVIKGACFLAFSINNIVSLGIRSAARPLLGLYSGSGDVEATRFLMRHGVRLTILSCAALTLLPGLFPDFVYRLNGVESIPVGGTTSLRFFLLCFVPFGVNALFRLYFSNRKDFRYATILAVAGNVALPIIALALFHLLSAPFIWMADLVCEASVLLVNACRYRWWRKRDLSEYDSQKKVLYLSVKPQDAAEASQYIEDFTDEHGYPHSVAYRMSLCMEEMVAYAVASQKDPDIEIQIMVRLSDDEKKFEMLDNGACIRLHENEETQALATSNYEVLERMAKSVEYQYIMNMNYTVITL